MPDFDAIRERARPGMEQGWSLSSHDGGQRYTVGLGPGCNPVLATFIGDDAHDTAWAYLYCLTDRDVLVAECDRLRAALPAPDAGAGGPTAPSAQPGAQHPA